MDNRGSHALWPRSALGLIGSGLVGLVALSAGRAPPVVTAAAIASAILVAAGLILIARRIRSRITSLADAAATDPLTGLFNRRGFQQAFDREFERAKRDGTPLAVIIADLDDFKRVNDRLGHMGGDMALERAGSTISSSIRAMDTAARLGGEEFAVLVPQAVSLEAFSLAERIRTRLQSAFEGTAAEVTLSAGVASFPGDGDGVEALFQAADEAMYSAKALGKNRSVIAQAERTQVSLVPAP